MSDHDQKPSDVIKPEWDHSGAIEDLRLFLALGRPMANRDRWPEWKDGSEFQERRAAMLEPTQRRASGK